MARLGRPLPTLELSDDERDGSSVGLVVPRAPKLWRCGAASCCSARRARPTARSRSDWGWTMPRSASGGGDSSNVVAGLVLVCGAPGDPFAGVFGTASSRHWVPAVCRLVEAGTRPFGALVRGLAAFPCHPGPAPAGRNGGGRLRRGPPVRARPRLRRVGLAALRVVDPCHGAPRRLGPSGRDPGAGVGGGRHPRHDHSGGPEWWRAPWRRTYPMTWRSSPRGRRTMPRSNSLTS